MYLDENNRNTRIIIGSLFRLFCDYNVKNKIFLLNTRRPLIHKIHGVASDIVCVDYEI